MSTPVVFRFRIRDAGNTTDAVVMTSIRAGTNPYLDSVPQGDGASVDPRTADSICAAYTGTIADWPLGSMQRAITSQLEDANQRQQLGYRRAIVESSHDNGVTWTVLVSGYLVLLKLVNGISWQYTVQDPTRAVSGQQVFGAQASTTMSSLLSAWPMRGCVFGGPLTAGPFLGMPTYFNGWLMKVHRLISPERYYLELVTGYGAPDWMPSSKVGNYADAINKAVGSMMQMGIGSGSLASFTTVQDALQYGTWSGLVYLVNGVPFRPIPPALYSGLAHDQNNPNALVANGGLDKFTGVFCALDGQTGLSDGQLVHVQCITILPSDTSPIYFDGHPVDLWTTVCTQLGWSYNAAAATALKNLIGTNLRIALRITAPQGAEEFLKSTVYQPFNIGVRPNSNGELEPFSLNIFANTPPATQINNSDVVQGETNLPFELDITTGVRSITLKQKILQTITSGANRDVLDGVSETDTSMELINSDPGALPDGDVTINVPGMIHLSDANTPVTINWLAARAGTLFDRFGRGNVQGETTFIRGGAGDSLKLGDEALINIAQLPNHNYRLGDNPAIAARAMQVIRITELPSKRQVRLADSGPNAQPLATVPVITLAPSSDQPRSVALATITNAATINGLSYAVRVQMAVTTGGVPASTDFTDLFFYPSGTVPTGSFRLPPVVAGRTVYLQARCEKSGTARPSNYGTPVGLTLSAINDPTGLSATPSGTDGSLCTLAWTPGSGLNVNDITDIYIRAQGSSFPSAATRVDTLPGTSTSYKLQGLTPGTLYTATVQHRDPRTNDLSDPVDVNFTAGATTRTLAAPVFAQGFAGTLDSSGAPKRDAVYGIAFIAAEYPGQAEVAVATETAVGSGTYGAFVTGNAWVPSVLGNYTVISLLAPNDGLHRQLKVRHVGTGLTPSAYSSVVTVLPWTPQALPAFPTTPFCEITVLSSSPTSDAGVNVRIQVTGIDPTGVNTPTVEILSLSGVGSMAVVAGAAVGTPVANNSIWRISQPIPGSGPGSITARTFVGSFTADATLAVAEQTTLAPSNGTVNIDSNGNCNAQVDGPANAQSFKWLAQVGSYPTDAAVIAGPSNVFTGARSFPIAPASLPTLSFSQTVCITVVPYTGPSGTGTQLPSIHIQGSFTSFSGSKTVNYSRVSLRRTRSINAIGEPDYTAADFSPSNPALLGDAVAPKSLALGILLVLPAGVTFSQAAFNATWNSATTPLQDANCFVIKNGSTVNSNSFTYASGAQTKTVSVGATVGASDVYFLVVNCFGPNSGAATADADQIFFGDMSVTYTMNTPIQGV